MRPGTVDVVMASGPLPPRYHAGMKIYTRTGDAGETSLLSGGRVAKDHARVEAYGTLDELNATLGVLATEPLPAGVVGRLQAVQETLFALGSALADPEGRLAGDPAAWNPAQLEAWIDVMDGELDELRSFILPGGGRAAALAHLARTVCRRAERRLLALVRGGEAVPEGVIPWVNRLSDALFVLARFLNARLGIADPEWHGAGRPAR